MKKKLEKRKEMSPYKGKKRKSNLAEVIIESPLAKPKKEMGPLVKRNKNSVSRINQVR